MHTALHRMINMDGTRYDLFEPDREANTLKITEKMENAKRINSLSRLSMPFLKTAFSPVPVPPHDSRNLRAGPLSCFINLLQRLPPR